MAYDIGGYGRKNLRYGAPPRRYSTYQPYVKPLPAPRAVQPARPPGYGGPRSPYGDDLVNGFTSRAPQSAPIPTSTGHRPPAQPAAAQPAQPAPGAPAATSAAPAPAVYDPYTDPAVQQIQALGTMNVGDAEAEATKIRKQLAIRLGSGKYAREILGDENTALAAEQNPLSTLARIRDQGTKQKRELLDYLGSGDRNLLYSGYRGTQESELAKSLLGQEAEAEDQFRGQEGEIARMLLGVRNSARDRTADAVARALAEQAARVQDGSGSGTAGSGTAGPSNTEGPMVPTPQGVPPGGDPPGFVRQVAPVDQPWPVEEVVHNTPQIEREPGQRFVAAVLEALDRGRQQRLLSDLLG